MKRGRINSNQVFRRTPMEATKDKIYYCWKEGRSLKGKMEVKVSLAETLKDWLSRREIYSFSCSVLRKMAGVPLKDHFASTDDIKGYAHIHSRYQKN